MPTRSLLSSESNNYQSHFLQLARRPCAVCSQDQRIASPHIEPCCSEGRSLFFAVMEKPTGKAASNGNGVCFQKDFCSVDTAAISQELSPLQVAALYLRAMRNELEYDTNILERIEDGCIAYIRRCFEDILAIYTVSRMCFFYCYRLIPLCRIRRNMFESKTSTWPSYHLSLIT